MSMENGGLTASDVAMLSNNGFGDGNAFMWIFALLILANGGFGGFGNNGFANAIGYENLATGNEVQRGFDFQNTMANQREILSAVNSGTAQSVAAINQTFHDTIGALGDKYGELARDIAALAVTQQQAVANQNECCCGIKMLVAENAANTNAQIAEAKYENAMQIAGLEARLNAKMDANTIQDLRDQLSDVKDRLNMSGVLRFPNQWSYGAGQFPPIFGGCCGQQNI